MTEKELEAEIADLEVQITEHVDDEFNAERRAMRDEFDRYTREKRQEHEALMAYHQGQLARYKRIGLMLDSVIMGWLIAFFTCSVIVGSTVNAVVNGALFILNGWRIHAMRDQDKKMRDQDRARETKEKPP